MSFIHFIHNTHISVKILEYTRNFEKQKFTLWCLNRACSSSSQNWLQFTLVWVHVSFLSRAWPNCMCGSRSVRVSYGHVCLGICMEKKKTSHDNFRCKMDVCVYAPYSIRHIRYPHCTYHFIRFIVSSRFGSFYYALLKFLFRFI